MTSPNSFHLHNELKIQGLIQAKKCEVFTSIPTFYWFFCCLKQKVIVLRTPTKPGCYFHPLLRVMGTSQSSSILLLQKWTTMKGNTYNERQWKRVFAPETHFAPEQSIKNMFSGPTNTAKLKLKAPKSWCCGTPREETYSASNSVTLE